MGDVYEDDQYEKLEKKYGKKHKKHSRDVDQLGKRWYELVS